jgi:cobalt-zinc-cadmium efflux system outer membrane protein
MRAPVIRRVGTWCVLASFSTVVFAQPGLVDGSDRISLHEAVAKTLAQNPGLKAFGYEISAQEGRIAQSNLRPGMDLDILAENVLGTGMFEGLDSAETTLSLGWLLERGKREYRVEAAQAGMSMLETEAEIQRLNAAAETAHIFLDCLANQEHLLRNEEALEYSEKMVEAVKKRVEAGRTPRAELLRAETELVRVRLDGEDVAHELLVSHRRLAAQWGGKETEFSRVNGNIYVLPVPDTFSSLIASVEQNPAIRRYLTQQRLREAELRLAEAEGKPDWRFTTGLRRFESTDDHAIVAGITIPLTTKKRNQGRMAEAQARLAMSGADQAATRIQIETRLFTLYQELSNSLYRAVTLREKILPQLELALTETERAYELGRYGYFELRLVQAEVLSTRSALVAASIDAHRSVIDIEHLTGTILTSPGKKP